jgi:CheY-like chemotaxis protein
LHLNFRVSLLIVQTTRSNEKLDALFRDLEQVTTDEALESSKGTRQVTDTQDNRVLGLGLAMVARIVRNMDGQLRLKSEVGKGSRFVIQLSLAIIEDDGQRLGDDDQKSLLKASINSSELLTPPPPASDDEITLVDKVSSVKADGVLHKRSVEEITSLRSFRSGSSNKSNRSSKSDVDRLIDAISGNLGEREGEPLQRSNSKGSGHSRKSAASLNHSTRESICASSERPGVTRSMSYSATEYTRSPIEGAAGAQYVTDNKTLLKAVRMPDEFTESAPALAVPHVASKVHFTPEKSDDGPPQGADHLQILVAEDDPVNSRIIKKRLEKSGHKVYHTVNGEECASAYGDKSAFFDVVLMDMQVSAL